MTSIPALAHTSAMPEPISPQPTTPTRVIIESPLFERYILYRAAVRAITSHSSGEHHPRVPRDTEPSLSVPRHPRVPRDTERWLSRRLNIGDGRPRCNLTQHQPALGYVDDREIGDGPLDDPTPGDRERTLIDDLQRAVLGNVLHRGDNALRPVHQVHRATHPFRHLPRGSSSWRGVRKR